MVLEGEARQIELVVTVKAYPAVGVKTGEAVCVAGVRTDEPGWVRLFPVPFRDLPPQAQFKKWQRIRLRVRRPRSDPRPESWAPDVTSIEVVGELRAGDWAERRRLVDALPERAMCEMNALNTMVAGRDVGAASLAVVRPREAPTLRIETRPAADILEGRAKMAQGALPMFASGSDPIEILEHVFKYEYRCVEPTCRGHSQSVIDWEIAQAYRRWRRDYPSDWQQRLKAKWEGDLWAADRDSRLFVGNQHQHPGSFLVLGVFWPPRAPLQLTLE